MNRKWAAVVAVALILALVAVTSALRADHTATRPSDVVPQATAQENPGVQKSDGDAPGAAATAIDEAARANKYTFLFFYRADDEPTQTARSTFAAAMVKLADRAVSASVNVADPRERAFVNKYGLVRSPMPLVMALAPNGAVTRGLPGRFTEAQLETAFVSAGMQKCLKALQDRKMAFICVQNATTQHNDGAMQGVKEFAADAQYVKTTDIITIDPADAAEESFLKQLKVNPKTEEAVTVFMAPPGTMVGTYQGETKKDVLVAAAKTAGGGCNPKSGCCPPKKPAAPQPDSSGKKP